MLSSVIVTTDQGSQLTIPLEDASAGFYIQDITGLDPVKAVVVSSTFATQDGEQYQSSRREKRNIVLTLGIEPDWSTSTVRALRTQLYTYFMPKSELTLTFVMDDGDSVDIVGRIESFDSPLFAKEPTATISILCFDPDFVDDTPITLTGNSVSDLTVRDIGYTGSVECGFTFKLLVNRALSGFSLINTPSDGSPRQMDLAFGSAPLAAGDVLTINTLSGSKGVTLTRSGGTSSLLYALSPYSDWINLFPGSNKFRVSATGAAIPYNLTYINRYGGL